MAGLMVTNHKRSNDPFALARELFSIEPVVRRAPVARDGFAPRFEVKETPDAFLIATDLPGVKEEAIEITFENRTLAISGSRVAEEKQENESYHVYERSYGSFRRTFTLPDNVDGEAIKARLESGVLTVIVPKKAEAKPRTIKIAAAD
jgi:HSP20 family protein